MLEHSLHNGGFPGDSDSKESACNAGDLSSIPGLGRSPGEGNDNPLQYPCLGNLMDRGAWRAAVYGVTKSQTQLSDFHFTCGQVNDSCSQPLAFVVVIYVAIDNENTGGGKNGSQALQTRKH